MAESIINATLIIIRDFNIIHDVSDLTSQLINFFNPLLGPAKQMFYYVHQQYKLRVESFSSVQFFWYLKCLIA